jgi:hypothetical protein
MTSGRAHRVAVPPPGGIDLDFGRTDYEVAFRLPLPGADANGAGWWARAAFGGMPAAPRAVLLLGWRFGLRLRLGPSRSPDYVLGWRLAERRPHVAALTAPSPLIDAVNIVLVDPSGVTWVTLLRYRKAVGRFMWAAAAPVHELTMPYLLNRAAANRRPEF